jgi:hypothetical protein
MLQNQPQTTSLFRTSLRTWQANYKARQQLLADPCPAEAEVAANAPVPSPRPRVKRLVARRRRQQVAAQG